jgi:hypothetical protein
MSGQLHASAAFTPVERAPCIHWIGGWVDPRAGLDDVEKKKFLTLPGLQLTRPLGRPGRSQSLYRLCYSGYLSKDGASHVNTRAILSNGKKVKENGSGTIVVRATQDNLEVVLEKLKMCAKHKDCGGTSNMINNCTHL